MGRPTRRRARSCTASWSGCVPPRAELEVEFCEAGAGGGAAPRSCSYSCSAGALGRAVGRSRCGRRDLLDTGASSTPWPRSRAAPLGAEGSVGQALHADHSSIDFDALARDVLPERADVLAPAIEEVGADTAIRGEGLDRLSGGRPLHRGVGQGEPPPRTGPSLALLTTGKSNRLTLERRRRLPRPQPRSSSASRTGLRERGFDRVADAIPPTVDGRIPLLTSDRFSTRSPRHQRAEGPELAAPAARAAVLRRRISC